MAMPTDVGIIDTMIGFPHEDMKEHYEFITKQTKDTRVEGGVRVPGRVHVQGRARQGAAATSTTRSRSRSREMDKWGIEKGLIGVGERRRRRRAGAQAAPRPVHRLGRRRPQRGHGGASARSCAAHETSTASAPSACSRRARSRRSPINDKKMYPIYAKCVRARHPGVLLRRRARARACKFDAAARRAHRRGDVRLPRARVRDPPRLRAVGRTSR